MLTVIGYTCIFHPGNTSWDKWLPGKSLAKDYQTLQSQPKCNYVNHIMQSRKGLEKVPVNEHIALLVHKILPVIGFSQRKIL